VAAAGGDLAGLFERFSLLQQKAQARTGLNYPIIVIQEAGLDGFWIHRALEQAGIESHKWTPPAHKRFGSSFDQIACFHMSDLFSRSHMNVGQDGFRDSSSKHVCDLRQPVALSDYLVSGIDRSHQLLISLQVLASAQHGCS
jgi:hypothetical protein